MEPQFFIADCIEFNSHPAADTYIRRHEKLVGLSLEQRRLETRRYRYPHRNAAVVMVIVGEHCVHLLSYEESGFAVREFFRGLGQSGTNPADSPHMLVAISAWS